MQIQRLEVTNVRNLSRVSLLQLGTINLFCGPNGSGKTSLLEAVHLLLVGRSFRQAQLKPLLKEGSTQCVVYAELLPPKSSRISLGVSRRDGGAKPQIRLNAQPLNQLSELVRIAPVQVLSADSFEILIGGPANRRQFLDWGLFHVEPGFYPAWKLAQRALKQRNSLIRHGKINITQLKLWTREYARYGSEVDSMRRCYIDQLLPICHQMAASLSDVFDEQLEAVYQKGWPRDQELEEALEGAVEGDIQQGFTRYGPHRADLKISLSSYAAADVLSRGQLKALVTALQLAQAELLQTKTTKQSIFLVDDLAAELDETHRQRLCSALERLKVQVFATGISELELVRGWSLPEAIKVFHVERGSIERTG